MNRVVSRQLMRLGAGILAILLAAGLGAPPVARASCGDYVRTGPESAGHGHVPPAAADHLRSGNGHLPCRGPGCSSRQLPPPVTPVTPVRIRVEQAGYPTTLAATLPNPSGPSILDDAAARPIHQHTSIFHPPRQADRRLA
jgi:hypothetical protein